MTQPVYIVSAVRTPMGCFQGALSNVPATQLGAVAIKGFVRRLIDPNVVDEVFMGQCCKLRQAPARQAAMGAGLGQNVPCTTVTRFAQVE